MSKAIVNEHQPSLSEWFSAISEEKEAAEFREEDSRKVDRLEILYQTIDLPHERPEKFTASDLFNKSPEFKKLLDERGDELCAIRFVPRDELLPKIRNRGLTIRDCYENWALQQTIDPDQYDAYVCPHTDELIWSAIFVVNDDMIFGEIVKGQHNQLTQGELLNTPYRFQYNFKTWRWSDHGAEAERQIKRFVEMVHVTDIKTQAKIQKQLPVAFSHDYIKGYFECTVWPGDRPFFIDFNRTLPKHIPTPVSFSTLEAKNKGITAYPGTITGTVVFVDESSIATVEFPEQSILLCDNTDVRYLPLMKKAGAIITARGGMLSHAAIVARELKVPCIVGAKDATSKLKSGDRVEVNATNGTYRKLAH